MKSNKKIALLLVIVILILLFNSFIFRIFNRFTLPLFIFLITGISIYLFGYRKNKNRYIKDTILTTTIFSLIFYLIIYLIGLIIGFNNNIYSLKIISILENVLACVLLILATELFRCSINYRFQKYNYVLILTFIATFLISNTFIINSSLGASFKVLLDNFALYFLPSLSTNVLLTYLSIKTGIKPNIVYRSLMEVPIYLLPILPAFGNYLWAVIRIVTPIILFAIFYKNKKISIVEKETISDSFRNNKYIFIFNIIVSIVLIITVLLTSGIFKYENIVIASNSMSPNIKRGDVVVVKKLNIKEKEKIGKDDIIAFKFDNKIVIHRVYDVIYSGDSVFYRTKGDNNNSPDAFLLEKDVITGEALFKIRYIGYPTLWLNSLINKKE